MSDPNEYPDEKELMRRLMKTPNEELPQPPGFEHEEEGAEKDEPTLKIEEIKTERIVQDGGGDEEEGLGKSLELIAVLLSQIRKDIRKGLFLD